MTADQSSPSVTADLAARARELDAAALGGPWHLGDANGAEDPHYMPFWVIGREQVSTERRDGEAPEEWLVEVHCGYKADAEFIAAARTLVPALADALDAALAREQQLREERDDYRKALQRIGSGTQLLNYGDCTAAARAALSRPAPEQP